MFTKTSLISGKVRFVGLVAVLGSLAFAAPAADAAPLTSLSGNHATSLVGVHAHESALSRANALATAKSYLRFMAFSRKGLIEQLRYEHYSLSDSTYAVDHCGANWNTQAVLKAKEYLKSMPFSRQGLIDQLVYEGFSPSQAAYGVKRVGL